MEMEEDEDGPSGLPTSQNEEFRPFIRRLPEFKFWYSATKATVIAFCCTFFQVFNIPVFWPILVMYFITLFCITMKRQIKHMIRFRYLPFTWGKPKFQAREEGKWPRTKWWGLLWSSNLPPTYIHLFGLSPPTTIPLQWPVVDSNSLRRTTLIWDTKILIQAYY